MISNTTPTQTQDPPSKLRKFYDRLTDKGIAPNLPDYQTFETTLSSDPQARRKLYDNLQSKGQLSLPDYETFQNTLFETDSEKPPQNAQNGSEISPLSGDLEGRHTIPLPKNEGLPGNLSPEEMQEAHKDIGVDGDAKSKNPKQILNTFWNVATKMLPSLMESMKAATYDKTTPVMHRGIPVDPAISEEENTQVRQQAIRNAIDKMGEFQEAQKNSVTQVSQIGDGIDVLNYIGNSIAQAGAQIPAALLTGGATSIGQEIGIIYMDQVEKIAEKNDMTPEEVIAEGKDDQASALAYGTAAGLLDYLGAKGATKMMPYGEFKKNLGQRAIGAFQAFKREALTEGAQSGIEQFGASRGAGESVIKSLSGVSINEMAEEGVAGGIGGGGINVGMQIADKFTSKAKKKEGGLPEGYVLKDPKVRNKMPEGWTIVDPSQEGQSQQQSIDMGAEFNFDPEASPEQQIEQLDTQRQQLESQRQQLEEQGEPTQDVDAAIAQIDKIQGDILEQDVQESDSETIPSVIGAVIELPSGERYVSQTHLQAVQKAQEEGHENAFDSNTDLFLLDDGSVVDRQKVLDNQKQKEEVLREKEGEEGAPGLGREFLQPLKDAGILKEDEIAGILPEDVQDSETFTEREQTEEVNEGNLEFETVEERVQEKPDFNIRNVSYKKLAKDQEGNEVGAISYVVREGDNEVHLERLDVNEDQRRKGIGSNLTKGVADEYLDKGYRVLSGTSLTKPAWEMFESLKDTEGITVKENPKAEVLEDGRKVVRNEEPGNSWIYEISRSEVETEADPRPAPPEQEFTEGREQQTEPIAVPDNPLPAQVDERYESWIDRDENADVPTIKVRNKEKGQEIDYKSNNRKDVITDFIRQGAPGLQDTESSIQQDIEGMNPEDADQFLNEAFDPSGNPTPKTVLERSENPAEIAEAISNRQQEYNNQIDGDVGVTLTERYWSEGQRLPVSNIKEWADWNTLPQNIKAQARNRDSYEGKLLGADQLAQELSGIMQREVSPEEVVQSFIEYHQSNVGRSGRQFNDPLSEQLARKFKDITGQKYTPSFGQELSQAHQESKASQTGIDQDISDYIDADGNINYNELLNSEGAYAEFIGNNSPLTQDEIEYANQQIRQYEQRQETQQREDSRGNEESEVSSQEDSGVPSQQEQGPAGLKEELSQKLETQGRDQSDYIKRRLQDIRDNPQVQQALEDMGEYTVQNVEAANRESDSLIADLQNEFGQKTGLRRSFKLLKEDQIPELMIGPMADKLALRMQKLNMNAEAKQVIDWMQQKGRDSARALRSMRSDASPESVVSRALAGLETKKQDALSKEFKDGKTYYDALNRIRAVLKDEQANQDNRSDKRVREDMISLVNDILKRDDESGKQRRIRKRTAQQIVDGYLDNLTSEELLNLFDDMAGFEILTTVEKSRIIDGATEVSELLREGKRELAKDKWIDLMEYLEEVNLQSRPVNELVYDLWYTGVLSGLTTVQRSLAGSTITASLHTAMKLMTNPKIAPLAISQMVKGFQGSLGTYINVLKTGRTNVQFADFKPKNPRYTDKLINNSFEDLNARDKVMKAIYTLPVYMYRNILAWDQVLKNGISEANMAFYEYDQVLDPDAPQSRRELIEQVKKNLAVDNEAKAREQAKYEVQKMKENGEDIPSGYQARRAREIIHNQRNQEFVDKALTEAARSALVEHPIGTLGKIYQTANQFLQVEEGDKIPLQMAKYMAKGLFPFLRVGANYTNAGLDYTPYGLVRAAKKERWTKHGMEEIGQTERNRIRGSAALGMSVFLSLIYGMFDWDEEEGLRLREGEDRWLDIVGPGTGNWWEQQDIGKGFKPWSVRMRNPVTGEWSDYYSYIDNPVGFALAPIGIMADRQRFTDFRRETRSTDRPEEFRGIKYLFGMGLLGTFQYSMDQSFNQGMNALGDILNSNNPETFSDNMYSAFGRPVEGFYPNVYNQMYTQYRALMDIPERDAEAWYENLARKVPIADGIIKNHRYDVFGYPIVRDFDVPMVPDMVLKMAKDNLTYREGRPEWELLWKYDEVVVGSFLPPFSHEGKRLTNQQRNAYQQEAGVRFRGKIQRRYNVLNLMTPEQLQKELLNYKRESAKEAREVILENKGFRITQPISDEN